MSASTIQLWQIQGDGKLTPVNASLASQGHTEPADMEEWIAKNPHIIAPDLLLIGRQVKVSTGGELDLLGIDSAGDLVIIELKRSKLPREALAQAIEYASSLANWDADRISEVCENYTGRSLEDLFTEHFDQTKLEDVTLNASQRILLVGFAIEDSLSQMVEWLFERYDVAINIIVLQYAKTGSGDELIARTAIIPEQIEKQRSKARKFKIPMSDEPGDYDEATLRTLVSQYLAKTTKTAQAIRSALLPLCLKHSQVTRTQLKEALVDQGLTPDIDSSYTLVANVSTQMGMQKNDFLRQIIEYGYPNHPWAKDDYRIRSGYEDLVRSVVE